MIFDRFFKAKWQHKDATVRITALKELDLSDQDSVQVVKQLISEDESELVRRSALLALDDFNVFNQQSKDNNNVNIRKFCSAQVQDRLLTSSNVSAKQKLHFIETCNKQLFIEQWLMVEQDSDVVKQLLNQVEKPNVLAQFVVQTNDLELQKQIILKTDDYQWLDKIAKKLQDGDIKQFVLERKETLLEAIQKPEKVTKQAQLILSKFLALKELNDYQQIINKRAEIDKQWSELELDCLADAQLSELMNKHKQIEQQLSKQFAKLEEDYVHQQAIIEQQQKLAKLEKEYKDHIKQVSQKISEAVFENVILDVEKESDLLVQVNDALLSSNLDKQTIDELSNQIKSLQIKLNKLPEVAQSVSLATSLISKLSTLALPTDINELNLRQPIFEQWKAQWQGINELANEILPISITKARKDLLSTWQEALAPLIKERQQAFDYVVRKIAELKRLITSGKYKSAFGLHTKLTHLIKELSEKQQLRIENSFKQVSEEIEKLRELEAFVVTPRKQELIEKITAIVEQPLDNPNEQASCVKKYRQQWNSLGHADEAIDAELNNSFNELCEKAFAPCREFYKQQAAIRENHLQKKQAILEQIKLLSKQVEAEDKQQIQWRTIDNNLHKLLINWRNSGEVERQAYQSLLVEFKRYVDPIKKGIDGFHQQNIELKQKLIEKAKTLVEQDDVFKAIEQLKTIQKEWQDIGFAGPKKDNSLWQTFRKVNDQAFTKRDNVVAEQKQQADKESQHIALKLTEIEEQASSLINGGDIKQIQKQLGDLNQQLSVIFEEIKLIKQNKSLYTKASSISKLISDILLNAKKKAKNQLYTNLFSCLTLACESFSQMQESSEYSSLNKAWQQQLLVSSKAKNCVELRHENTIKLEIALAKESPDADKAKRMALQIEIMANNKMQAQQQDKNELLSSWIECSSFSKEHLAFVERVKEAFS